MTETPMSVRVEGARTSLLHWLDNHTKYHDWHPNVKARVEIAVDLILALWFNPDPLTGRYGETIEYPPTDGKGWTGYLGQPRDNVPRALDRPGPTARTPMYSAAGWSSLVPVNTYATYDGLHVVYRHSCGTLLALGRPWAIGQTLDDIVFRYCPVCDPRPEV